MREAENVCTLDIIRGVQVRGGDAQAGMILDGAADNVVNRGVRKAARENTGQKDGDWDWGWGSALDHGG